MTQNTSEQAAHGEHGEHRASQPTLASLNLVLDDLEDTGQLSDPLELYSAFSDWAARGGRPLYPHQVEAAEEIMLEGRHVIAATPTGSGKSMIGLAAHFYALATGQTSYYTAPLKALVSEKFFDLINAFGAANVGMVTGDISLNPGAPIICCTAEILANQALASGDALGVGIVVMDEFHYYGDPQRGWAWQAPLLTLTKTQFVLMSATLGPVDFFQSDLLARTGREVALVDQATRPVPLEYSYSTDNLPQLLERLAMKAQTPAYVVFPSQKAALSQAQSLTSLKLANPEQLASLNKKLAGFRFAPGFGQTLRKLLKVGIGVHHAGMLPRYRRLVEQAAQDGDLAIICGTDTLGVGINVPIRTVVLTSLVKFDGNQERHLSAREFHQLAGRAGRAGFDTVGYVVVQGPAWEIENSLALARAAGDEKKLRKIAKKKPATGEVSWNHSTFERLINAQSEALVSRWQVTHSMVLATLRRCALAGADPEQVAQNLLALALDNHDQAARKAQNNPHLRQLTDILTSLLQAEVITYDSAAGWQLAPNIPRDFALNQALSPFALAALEVLSPFEAAPTTAQSGPTGENQHLPQALDTKDTQKNQAAASAGEKTTGETKTGGAARTERADSTLRSRPERADSALRSRPERADYALDVLSVIEAVVDDPRPVLLAQRDQARSTLINQLKAEGVEYDERMRLLEQVTWPQPLGELLQALFSAYVQSNPWARGLQPSPKSVVRQMVETGATFTSFISRYDLMRSEGVLLRYLTDVYRTARQLLDPQQRTESVQELLDWLGTLVASVDRSLLDEWERIEAIERGETYSGPAGDQENTAEETAEMAFGQRPDGSIDFSRNPAALQTLVRRETFRFVQAVAADDPAKVARLENTLRGRASDEWTRIPPVGENGVDQALGELWEEYEWIDTTAEGRSGAYLQFTPTPEPADFPTTDKVSLALADLAGQRGGLLVEQVLVDDASDLAWSLWFLIDPQSSSSTEGLAGIFLGLRPR